MKHNLIGISGKAGSGKNTVASFLQSIDHSFEQKAFAAKLKQIANILTGIPINMFEDQEFKKTSLGEQWGDITVRDLLQQIATECMRDCIHPDIWVNALFADYTDQCWLVTDVRFPNEYKAIKDRGGIILRIERPGSGANDHISEVALDNHPFDYIIYNDGSTPDLFKQVLTFYETIIM